MVNLEGSCQRTEEFGFMQTATTKGDFLETPLLTITARQHNRPGPCDTVPMVNLTYKFPRHGFVQANLLPTILNASLRGGQHSAIQQPVKGGALAAGHVAGQLSSPIREALDTNGRLWSHTAQGNGNREEKET